MRRRGDASIHTYVHAKPARCTDAARPTVGCATSHAEVKGKIAFCCKRKLKSRPSQVVQAGDLGFLKIGFRALAYVRSRVVLAFHLSREHSPRDYALTRAMVQRSRGRLKCRISGTIRLIRGILKSPLGRTPTIGRMMGWRSSFAFPGAGASGLMAVRHQARERVIESAIGSRERFR